MRSPTWTDAELLHHDFKVLDRPELAEPDLNPAKPPGGAIRFLQSYDITPPSSLRDRHRVQPYVWCALCQKITHWKGWIAEYDQDGASFRCLIGKDCAMHNGGEVIRLAARDFEERLRRADALRTRQAVLPLLDPARKALEAWGVSPGVAAVLDWRAQLRNLSSHFHDVVMEAAKASPPVLLLEEEVRDHAAEERIAARRGKSAKIDPLYKTIHVAHGQIVGAALYNGPSPTARIRLLLERLAAAAAQLRRPTQGPQGATPTRAIEEALRQIKDVLDGARDLERAYRGFEAGLTPEALSVIVDWHNRRKYQTYEAEKVGRYDRKLIIDRSWGARTSAVLPQPAPIVRPVTLDRLEEALRGRAGQSNPGVS